MPEFINNPPSPPCYHLFSETGISEFQQLGPDLFCLVRATRSDALPREAPVIRAANLGAFPTLAGACPVLGPGR